MAAGSEINKADGMVGMKTRWQQLYGVVKLAAWRQPWRLAASAAWQRASARRKRNMASLSALK
jgi:hypothetical protein